MELFNQVSFNKRRSKLLWCNSNFTSLNLRVKLQMLSEAYAIPRSSFRHSNGDDECMVETAYRRCVIVCVWIQLQRVTIISTMNQDSSSGVFGYVRCVRYPYTRLVWMCWFRLEWFRCSTLQDKPHMVIVIQEVHGVTLHTGHILSVTCFAKQKILQS